MSVEACCRKCYNYFAFFDDCGELLVDGCDLDLPIFKSDRKIICNSYRRGE